MDQRVEFVHMGGTQEELQGTLAQYEHHQVEQWRNAAQAMAQIVRDRVDSVTFVPGFLWDDPMLPKDTEIELVGMYLGDETKGFCVDSRANFLRSCGYTNVTIVPQACLSSAHIREFYGEGLLQKES